MLEKEYWYIFYDMVEDTLQNIKLNLFYRIYTYRYSKYSNPFA